MGSAAPLDEPLQGQPSWQHGSVSGQAYTEYLLILLFGVFLGLGIVVIDREGILPEQLRIVDRLYGYVFDYYSALANYLNLSLF